MLDLLGLTSSYTVFDSKRKSNPHRFEVRRTRHWAVVLKAESMRRVQKFRQTIIWFGEIEFFSSSLKHEVYIHSYNFTRISRIIFTRICFVSEMVPSLRARSGRGRTMVAGSRGGHLGQGDGSHIRFVRAESQEGLDERQDSDRADEDTEPDEVAGVREEILDPRVQGAEVRINRLEGRPEHWGPRSMRRGSRTSQHGSQSSSGPRRR